MRAKFEKEQAKGRASPLDSEPTLLLEEELPWECALHLIGSRSVGFEKPNPVSPTDFVSWCSIYRIESRMTRVFLWRVVCEVLVKLQQPVE